MSHESYFLTTVLTSYLSNYFQFTVDFSLRFSHSLFLEIEAKMFSLIPGGARNGRFIPDSTVSRIWY